MWFSLDKRSGFYRVFWLGANGRQQSISSKQTSKPAAIKWAKEAKIEELESASRASLLTPQVAARIMHGHSCNVDQAIDQWKTWATGVARQADTTIRQSEVTLRAWARDTTVGARDISTVTTTEINNYINRESDRKASSANNELSILRRFFEQLRNDGIINTNPAGNSRLSLHGLSHRQKESGGGNPFTEAEVATLVRSAPTTFWRAAIEIAANTGLRLGDIAGMEWASLSDRGGLIVWTDKTDTRVSHALSSDLAAKIAALPRTSSNFLFPEQMAIVASPRRRAYLSVQFTRICRRAGIFGKSFHSLRRYYSCHLASQGVKIEEIAERLGHSNTETTQIYLDDSRSNPTTPTDNGRSNS